jgi:multiple sugar transport system permease protein
LRERYLPLIFIAPALILLLGLVAYPFLMSLYMSLTDKRIGGPGEFIGLANYARLLRDDMFQQTIKNTLTYASAAVIIKTVLGMALALSLAAIPTGRRLIRSVLLLPWVVPTSLSVLAWWWMFEPTLSVVNWVLHALGLGAIPWLSDPFWARVAVITVNAWRGIPFFAVAFLSGLVSIPTELYEAAEADGANAVRAFWSITLPLMRPVLAIVVLYSVVMTVGDFEIVYILTRGGPFGRTHLFSTYAFQIGLHGTEIGLGAAASLFIFPVLAVASFLMMRVVRAGEQYA